MTDQTQTHLPRQKSLLRTLAIISGVMIILLVVTGLVAQRRSDGPSAFIPGGPLRTGSLVSETDIDWASVLDENPGSIELQLVDPPTSRITGVMLHDGQLYVPCDLGFMWRRFSGSQRWITHLIWVFKTWHEDALLDGRVVMRIGAKRYERQAVLVTDPALLARLRSQLEEMAVEYFGGPLPDVQTDPEDIWFFRMDPRPTLIAARGKQDSI